MNYSEKNFENKVRRFLRGQGCWVLKTWGGGYQRSGLPDLLICCNGYFVAAELKSDTGKPSQLQLWNIEKIKEAGGKALVLYSKDFEEFKKMIKELKK